MVSEPIEGTLHGPRLEQGRPGIVHARTGLDRSSGDHALLTGRYPHAIDAEQLHWALPGHDVTLAEQLRAAGYRRAAAGKWHLGEEVSGRFDVIHEASTGSSRAEVPGANRKGVECEERYYHAPNDKTKAAASDFLPRNLVTRGPYYMPDPELVREIRERTRREFPEFVV